jgi:D-alanyl-D-alanine carboxypeptidase (penicillin-binding protein 5/6)
MFIALALILVSAGIGSAQVGPELPARAYLLMDATTGQVLYARHDHDRLPIASTTKIMTAILALERGNLADVVTTSQKAFDTGGSTIYLELGEQQTLSNLLYALLLESANDAAVAIAEHIGGTEGHFVELMNQKAQEIGATDTHFVNSHGLHEPDHYSSAHDLALIARYAMQNAKFREYVHTEEQEIPGYDQNPPRKLHSHNQLLGYYDGANGVKNGWTDEALQTNVASAKRGDTELIAVVLGAKDRVWSSSMALLDYGFSGYKTLPVVKKGEPVGTTAVPGAPDQVPAVAAGDLLVTVALDGTTPQQKVVWDDGLKLPLAQGAHLGRLQEVDKGQAVGQVDLVSALAIAAPATLSGHSPLRVPPLRTMVLGGVVALVVGVLARSWLQTGSLVVRRDRP